MKEFNMTLLWGLVLASLFGGYIDRQEIKELRRRINYESQKCESIQKHIHWEDYFKARDLFWEDWDRWNDRNSQERSES